MQEVIKRDGRKVPYDKTKISNAIFKAYNKVYPDKKKGNEDSANYITGRVDGMLGGSQAEPVSIEYIQDLIEKELMGMDKDVAKAYTTYRYRRALARDEYRKLMKDVQEKITASNVQNQNANMDENSFGGRIGETTNMIMKRYALNYCLSPMARKNHEENRIYVHDLDHYPVGDHNCLSVPFDALLKNGFNTRQTDVRPAQSASTAFQLVAVIFQLQSLQQFGGVSTTHLDWTMVPYVRKSFAKHFKDGLVYIAKQDPNVWFNLGNPDFSIEDDYYKSNNEAYAYAMDMTTREVYQAAEGLYHNLNTLQSRSGNQLPFTSINYGTCTLPEGRLVTKALLEVSIKGIGKLHKTSIFPCGIFQCKKGVNREKDSPNYDLYKLSLKSTALRLYPNYANCDNSMQLSWIHYDRQIKQEVIGGLSDKERRILMRRLKTKPELRETLMLNLDGEEISVDMNVRPFEEMSTMGCRTQNGADINAKESYAENVQSVIRHGRLANDILSAAQKDGRGNICPVTVILPTIAMEAVENPHIYATNKQGAKVMATESPVEAFMTILDKTIHEAKDMLLERFEWICSQNPKSAKFMYENNLMAGYDGKNIRSALKHGTLALGQLGLAEALQILIGCDHTEQRGMELAKRIEKMFKDRCAEFKEQYKLNFGVYYTPAENLCYTAMQKFKEKYGEIPNVSDKEFFTNSIHVPVWKELTPFEKIDIEAQLTGYSNAGCITYVELSGTVKHNLEALEDLVNYAMDKDIPYCAINVPNDMCQSCGYTDEINTECPMCECPNIRRLRRVTGYLTGDFEDAFNEGKKQETRMRVKHAR